MNANEMTFGIELETTIPVGTLAVGPHGEGTPIPQLPGWLADRDGSIHTGHGRQACEFVSPVFVGTAGLKQLVADLATIKALGAKVNRSCGLHIHVGVDRTDSKLMEKLATLVSNFETAIYASTGTKHRERSRWCNPVSRHGDAERALRASTYDRYHVCNFGTDKPTVEFRAFSGSLNPQKIVAWTRLAVGLVERASSAKRATTWTPKPVSATSPIHRKGAGQTAVTRLSYQLGWVKGRQPHTFGNLADDSLPSIKSSKRELIRLARKYDAQP